MGSGLQVFRIVIPRWDPPVLANPRQPTLAVALLTEPLQGSVFLVGPQPRVGLAANPGLEDETPLGLCRGAAFKKCH